MLKQKELYYLDQRLREINGCNIIFGGLAILMVGDIGQLPAVKGSVLWNEKCSNVDDRRGWIVYQSFDVLTRLTVNERLDMTDADAVAYSEILTRLHDGKNTRADAELISSRCSRHAMGRAL